MCFHVLFYFFGIYEIRSKPTHAEARGRSEWVKGSQTLSSVGEAGANCDPGPRLREPWGARPTVGGPPDLGGPHAAEGLAQTSSRCPDFGQKRHHRLR